eukprot:TRINITY_DN44608_c0_g1_i1.p1 TRINITY_DN44608_c0_g1~~TRINITY_DN44608_c0_g1_i1.p1  ORF type:complete len:461 (+),score=88.52 TRINITY_DN44608_c0_g1_i1:83-1384(+)
MDDASPVRFDEQHEAAIVIQKQFRAYQERKKKKVEDSKLQDGQSDDCDSEHATSDLLDRYRSILEEQQRLFERNARYQTFLFAHQDDKKVTDVATDADANYVRLLGRLYHENTAFSALRDEHQRYLSDFEARVNGHLASSHYHVDEFRRLRDSVLLGGINEADPFQAKRIGAVKAEIAAMDKADEQRDAELARVRVEHLKQRTRQRRQTRLLRDRDRVAAKGLHLIDFEQLKIENASWNEKIEERNEETLKLRKKATTTIHTLTHIKEKLTFCLDENRTLRSRLAAVDSEVIAARDALAKLKKERDSLATDAVRMRDRTPLVGAHDLLVDFETRKARVAALQQEVTRLRAHHQALVAHIAGYHGVFKSASSAAAARAPALLATVGSSVKGPPSFGPGNAAAAAAASRAGTVAPGSAVPRATASLSLQGGVGLR